VTAGDTFSPPTNGRTFTGGTRIDDLIVLTTAFGTAHDLTHHT
jgi:hypothetical protein